MEVNNVRNGYNFAKKVLSTGECDLLILDEVLALVDIGIITENELCEALAVKSSRVNVILTGIRIGDRVSKLADEITILSSGAVDKG